MELFPAVVVSIINPAAPAFFTRTWEYARM